MSNTGSPRFTDFPSFCACSESSLTNLIGSGLSLLCLQAIQNRNVVGPGQRSRFLVMIKRSAASGDENGVDDSRIRGKIAPFSFENGLVWMGPYCGCNFYQ